MARRLAGNHADWVHGVQPVGAQAVTSAGYARLQPNIGFAGHLACGIKRHVAFNCEACGVFRQGQVCWAVFLQLLAVSCLKPCSWGCQLLLPLGRHSCNNSPLSLLYKYPHNCSVRGQNVIALVVVIPCIVGAIKV